MKQAPNRQLLDEAITEQDRCLARFREPQRSLRTSTDAHAALLNRPNQKGVINQAENLANPEQRERLTTLNEIPSTLPLNLERERLTTLNEIASRDLRDAAQILELGRDRLQNGYHEPPLQIIPLPVQARRPRLLTYRTRAKWFLRHERPPSILYPNNRQTKSGTNCLLGTAFIYPNFDGLK
jgi:hypothetical protein